jgi:CRP-like cAMP-binding protein
LLAALPEADFQRLAPRLTVVPVDRGRILLQSGEPFRYVYFPDRGVFSVAAVLADGATIEAATVGDEGMLGIESFFSDTPVAPGHVIVEIADGSVARLDVETLRREIQIGGALYDLLARYIPFFVAQTMHVASCNALHQSQQRLARWLLMTQERLRASQFRVSHEFLGTMLGARRPTITVAAAALQRAGAISYSHGRVTVRDRAKLEVAACPCYAVLRAQLAALWEGIDGDKRAPKAPAAALTAVRRAARP